MTISPVEETHVRKCRVVIDRRELEGVIKAHVLRKAGFYSEATEIKLQFLDVLEGSPGYRVGTQCIADLIEDQMKLPRAEQVNEAKK